MKTAVIALLAAAAFAANPTPKPTPKPAPTPAPAHTLGYCAQGQTPLCHGPAGAGPSPSDGAPHIPNKAGAFMLDPSQWLCAGIDADQPGAHKFTQNTTWDNHPSSDYCDSQSKIGANSACPAFCGMGSPTDFLVPYPTAAGFANDVTGGKPCTGPNCECYGVTTQTAKGTDCAPQKTACDSWKVKTPGKANAGLTFANEIPFADDYGGLHARCSGSVLTAVCLPCADDPSTKGGKKCDCTGETSPGGDASYANCADWSKQCTQIPTRAQWVEDTVTQVYKDGYDLENSKYDKDLDPAGGWGRHIPGYFHGIVPNYKTNVQLDVGQLVLVRVWSNDAASIMPADSYFPTDKSPFQATGVAFDSICNDKDSVTTGDLKGIYANREWCWKRGKIAIYMAEDTYVVTIEGTAAVVKGVTAYDVRPICFDAAPTATSQQNQEAECSTIAGECTNMAGQAKDFPYSLGQNFAVKDDKTNTITIKTVNSIDQATKNVTTTKGEVVNLQNNADIMHCFPADDTVHPQCTNAYSQVDPTGAKTVNPHYGLEIMRITGPADPTKRNVSGATFQYSMGTIKSFADAAGAAPAMVSVNCAANLVPWALTLMTTKVDGVLPICYPPAPLPPTPPPASSS